jgi:hypothetical protein
MVGYASLRAHNNKTSRSSFHHKLKHGAVSVARVFITPTVSSKASRRPLGLKVGYASSRAHNNKTSRSGLGFHPKLKHGLKCCVCRSCFQNSNGVFKRLAQAARIEGGLCEFACAPQQD